MAKDKTKLSIIILNRNTAQLLSQCLLSLPKKPEYQVIVVDNNSTDDSVNMVRKDFPWVELVTSPKNLGFSAGNNLARNSVQGEYVLFLNSDTKVFPDTIETMVKFMDNNKLVGVSTCLTVLPNGQLYYACHRGFPTPWNSLCYLSGLAKIFPNSKLFSGYTLSYLPLDTIHEIDACSGTFLLIRKILLEKIDWFDSDYYAYGEDIEMCYRAKELGYKVMFNPHVKILHYWGASSGLKSTSKGVTTASEANKSLWNQARYDAMKIFYDKHYKDNYPKFLRPFIFLAINVANFLRRGKD